MNFDQVRQAPYRDRRQERDEPRMNRLRAATDRFEEWYRTDALPLWARAAADRAGAFYEQLDFNGGPVTGTPRRVRVQSRQIHSFTRAALAGWLPEGDAIADRGFRRLLETACPDNAARGCAHLVDDDGRIIDATRDLYDQAFLILAAAARIVAGDDTAREIAERTLAFIDSELGSEHGGHLENDRRSLPRRQNPHMHLFEATMALYAATGDPAHLARARAVESLFNTRFLDRNAGVLREFFADDWSLDPQTGDRIEPGHMVEWAFLLDRFEALSGEDRSEEKNLLHYAARSMTAPDDAPFLPNSARLGAAPARRARRLWPQTEALKAALVLGRDEEAADLIDAMFGSYLNQETSGLWCDEYDAEGRPAAKAAPASILYHLHEAVSCAVERRHKITP